ncbi:hypothetical protein LINPERHAP1_LOCUS14480 [Linum perenne]
MEANMKATDNHPGAPLQGFQYDSVKRLDLSTTVDTLHHKVQYSDHPFFIHCSVLLFMSQRIWLVDE